LNRIKRCAGLLTASAVAYVLFADASINRYGRLFDTTPSRLRRRMDYDNIVKTEFTDEPSHIRMCRHLMPRFDYVAESEDLLRKAYSMGIKRESIEDFTPEDLAEMGIVEEGEEGTTLPFRPPDMDDLLIVEEDEEVCVDDVGPHFDLLQIFSSHLLSIASRKFGLNVEYRHNCHQWRRPDEDPVTKPVTIQEMLHSSLLIDSEDGSSIEEIPIELLAIRNVCGGCLQEVEETGIAKRNCALFTRPTVYNPLTAKKAKNVAKRAAGMSGTSTSSATVSYSKATGFMLKPRMKTTINNPSHQSQLPIGFVAIIPSIRRNLARVSDLFDQGLTAFYGGEAERANTLASRVGQPEGLTSIIPEDYKLGEQGAYSTLTDDDAVVYLACKKEQCEEEEMGVSFAVPYFTYLLHIPRHVSRISVIADKDCVDHMVGCREHGQALTTFLAKHYPRATVSFIEEASTFAGYSRMNLADYLVCPPGISCFIPALVSGVAKSTLVANPNIVPWLSQIGEAELKNVTLLDMAKTFVAPVDNMDYGSFLNKLPPHEEKDCRFLRGRMGKWKQDMFSALEFQYPSSIRHYVGEADLRFIPTAETPYRVATTYRWEEDLFSQCGLETINRDAMCQLMKDLGMSRIFIVGDSLGMNMAQSLWKLMGHEDNPTEFGVRNPNWDRAVQCDPDDEEDYFVLSFARSDQLIENNLPVDVEQGIKNCYAYCYPWSERYTTYDDDTIFIMNTGPHYQTHHQFQAVFDEFVRKVDSFQRPRDIVLWRTSVPGHPHCDDPNSQKPFDSFQEYVATEITDDYSWDKFVGYNDYANKALDTRRRQDRVLVNLNGAPAPVLKPPGSLMSVSDEKNGIPTPRRTRIELLDVYPMTVQRPDGHVSSGECEDCPGITDRDCLHYFLPGPPDWWNHLLYSHLLELTLKENQMQG